MGTDNFFRSGKTRAATDLSRKKAKRKPYDKVLIVCEGEKTEPNYFNGLISHYKLNSANVVIDGGSGSSPRSVFDTAKKLYKAEQKRGDQYDRVYCVFDKDTHETYNETLHRIAAQKPRDTFFHALSVPCFEYWLILHFKYTEAPYSSVGKNSCAQQALKKLQELNPDYKKGQKEIFKNLVDKLDFATNNAEKALNAATRNRTDNPSTHVHELVDYLKNIKN